MTEQPADNRPQTWPPRIAGRAPRPLDWQVSDAGESGTETGDLVIPPTQRVAPAEQFVCPRCSKASASATDLAEGYCGNCHAWTVPPARLTEYLLKARPVILVHLQLDNRGLAACCGRRFQTAPENAYPEVPRLLCPACYLAVVPTPRTALGAARD